MICQVIRLFNWLNNQSTNSSNRPSKLLIDHQAVQYKRSLNFSFNYLVIDPVSQMSPRQISPSPSIRLHIPLIIQLSEDLITSSPDCTFTQLLIHSFSSSVNQQNREAFNWPKSQSLNNRVYQSTCQSINKSDKQSNNQSPNSTTTSFYQ